jgi:L-lactate dehydrogenase complex protein LldG
VEKATLEVLENLDVLVLKSDLWVAEDGIFWLSENELLMRVLPSITKHLVLVLKEDDAVSNMQVAYKRLKHLNTDYDVSVSGPSKTADLEQSLVIGAHGL